MLGTILISAINYIEKGNFPFG